MNSKSSGTFDTHRLLLTLAGKIDLQRSDKLLLDQILASIIHGNI